jgi:hypothetical protein
MGQVAAWARNGGCLVGVRRQDFGCCVRVDGRWQGRFCYVEAKGWALPEPHTKTKRGGGAHYLVRNPDGKLLKNSASKLGDGLDTRGDGGYIVWWPAHGGDVEHPDMLADVPAWLLDALQSEPAPDRKAQGVVADGEGFTEGRRNDSLFRRRLRCGEGADGGCHRGGAPNRERGEVRPALSADEVRTIAQSTGAMSRARTGGERCAYVAASLKWPRWRGLYRHRPGWRTSARPVDLLPPLVRAKTRDPSRRVGALAEWKDDEA